MALLIQVKCLPLLDRTLPRASAKDSSSEYPIPPFFRNGGIRLTPLAPTCSIGVITPEPSWNLNNVFLPKRPAAGICFNCGGRKVFVARDVAIGKHGRPSGGFIVAVSAITRSR